jgi:hypothetical protein
LCSAGLASLAGRTGIDRTLVDLKRGGGRAINLSRRYFRRLHPRLRRGIARRRRRRPDFWSWPRISLHGGRHLRRWTRLDRSHCWSIRARSGSGIVRSGCRPGVWSCPRISIDGGRDLRRWVRLERSHWWPIRLRGGRANLRCLGRNCSLRWRLLWIWSAAICVNSGIFQLRANSGIVLLR